MLELLDEITRCKICAPSLDHDPRPVLSAHRQSRIAIIGQAPGAIVHRTGIPWDDKSGENFRGWLDVDSDTFYDERKFALVPMSFCYPGKGKSGDLPPRPDCAPAWHERVLAQMRAVRLVLLVGKYSQDHYLEHRQPTLTATVRSFRDYLPRYFVLPHPSPRNNIWRAKNPWFSSEVLPALRDKVAEILA